MQTNASAPDSTHDRDCVRSTAFANRAATIAR